MHNLASLYGVETRTLNQAVKRNRERFPDEYCFQLNDDEFSNWKSQIVMSNNNLNLRSQIVTSNNDLNLKSQFSTSKNWFALSKMDIGAIDMLTRLEGMKVGGVKQ